MRIERGRSIGTALLKSPSVIFMDEPTSGLDAAAAASIMKFTKELAVAANVVSICTIHQPSAAVFAGFDQGVLLVVILATSLVMTAALIQHGSGIQPVADHDIGALPNAPRPSDSALSRGDDGANAAGPETVQDGEGDAATADVTADVTRGGTPGPAGDESTPAPQG